MNEELEIRIIDFFTDKKEITYKGCVDLIALILDDRVNNFYEFELFIMFYNAKFSSNLIAENIWIALNLLPISPNYVVDNLFLDYSKTFYYIGVGYCILKESALKNFNKILSSNFIENQKYHLINDGYGDIIPYIDYDKYMCSKTDVNEYVKNTIKFKNTNYYLLAQ